MFFTEGYLKMKYFKKSVLAVMISSAMSVSPIVNASGIPTLGVAELAESVASNMTRVMEFQQSIENARSRLNEAISTADHYKNMVEGHYPFEDILNDAGLNEFADMSAWKSIYDDASALSDYKEEFQLFDENPTVQRRFDARIKAYAFQKSILKQSQVRSKGMSDLMKQFGLATTPAAKADIANSIALEQAQMENDSAMFKSVEKTQEEEFKLERAQRSRESANNILTSNYVSYF